MNIGNVKYSPFYAWRESRDRDRQHSLYAETR